MTVHLTKMKDIDVFAKPKRKGYTYKEAIDG